MTAAAVHSVDTSPSWVVHRAGPVTSAGLQLCTRCRVVLLDYSGTQPRPAMYSARAQVARFAGELGSACVQFEGPLQPDMRLCTEGA